MDGHGAAHAVTACRADANTWPSRRLAVAPPTFPVIPVIKNMHFSLRYMFYVLDQF
jgi:hypothetical protein